MWVDGLTYIDWSVCFVKKPDVQIASNVQMISVISKFLSTKAITMDFINLSSCHTLKKHLISNNLETAKLVMYCL